MSVPEMRREHVVRRNPEVESDSQPVLRPLSPQHFSHGLIQHFHLHRIQSSCHITRSLPAEFGGTAEVIICEGAWQRQAASMMCSLSSSVMSTVGAQSAMVADSCPVSPREGRRPKTRLHRSPISSSSLDGIHRKGSRRVNPPMGLPLSSRNHMRIKGLSCPAHRRRNRRSEGGAEQTPALSTRGSAPICVNPGKSLS